MDWANCIQYTVKVNLLFRGTGHFLPTLVFQRRADYARRGGVACHDADLNPLEKGRLVKL
ncbi:hypothetical protein GFER_04145 [Geoalkalibacter ferrihydriticus DSM 17813]|uniref:Uncharacterized protein n=1 Tax=Geoalkalibacter ferrihydriticus DSM 17813 TaxID=1121915 RepID=A0A0C2HL80_9BACT|nr:hypothetical protein GFER_04145 [Geoalkalibacter ferrihydriticus DSM 17813]